MTIHFGHDMIRFNDNLLSRSKVLFLVILENLNSQKMNMFSCEGQCAQNLTWKTKLSFICFPLVLSMWELLGLYHWIIYLSTTFYESPTYCLLIC